MRKRRRSGKRKGEEKKGKKEWKWKLSWWRNMAIGHRVFLSVSQESPCRIKSDPGLTCDQTFSDCWLHMAMHLNRLLGGMVSFGTPRQTTDDKRGASFVFAATYQPVRPPSVARMDRAKAVCCWRLAIIVETGRRPGQLGATMWSRGCGLAELRWTSPCVARLDYEDAMLVWPREGFFFL